MHPRQHGRRGRPLFRIFEHKDNDVLAEFATHVKIAVPLPTTCWTSWMDMVFGRLMEVNDEIEDNSDLFATGTRVHLKFASEICAGCGGVRARGHRVGSGGHGAERRRRGRLRQPAVRQRHMTR